DQQRRNAAREVGPERITPRPKVVVIGRIERRVRTNESPQVPENDYGDTNQERYELEPLPCGICSWEGGCTHDLTSNAEARLERLTVKLRGRPEALDQATPAHAVFGAGGANIQAVHGPLQRLSENRSLRRRPICTIAYAPSAPMPTY